MRLFLFFLAVGLVLAALAAGVAVAAGYFSRRKSVEDDGDADDARSPLRSDDPLATLFGGRIAYDWFRPGGKRDAMMGEQQEPPADDRS